MNSPIHTIALSLAGLAAASCLAGATPENGITAHRGDSLRFPENSLQAFQSANDIGADWIETDVYLTKDGKLVVAHNPTTGAYSSKNLSIAGSTYAELAELDMAEKFRERNKKTLAECPKLKILLFEEALDYVLATKKARLSIQPKSDCVDAVMAVIRQKGGLDWVGFNDGSLKKMSRVKELEPKVPVFWDRWRSDLAKDIAIAKARKFEYIVPNCGDLTPEMVKDLHAAGFKVGVWTVNSRTELARFLDMGVDRIYTDVPAVLKEIKAQRRATVRP